jgi:hypothetical protein
MTRSLLLCSLAVFVACGPGRTAYQRYPNAPATFNRAGSEAKALEIADKVFAAAGGPTNWEKAKQIMWHQTVTSDGKVVLDGEEAWDRWNARHHGRLHRPEQDVVVGYELYGKFRMGFLEKVGHKTTTMDDDSRDKAVTAAQALFNVNTAVMCMQFLMFDPGAKLTYVGPVKDDAGTAEAYDDVKVMFEDPLRSNIEFHVIVDRKDSMILRIEMIKVGTTEKIGFTLKDWTTVNGLKFATSRGNLGYSGETTAIKEIKVSDPEDSLFIAPL